VRSWTLSSRQRFGDPKLSSPGKIEQRKGCYHLTEHRDKLPAAKRALVLELNLVKIMPILFAVLKQTGRLGDPNPIYSVRLITIIFFAKWPALVDSGRPAQTSRATVTHS
jgi:hypothetical protein